MKHKIICGDCIEVMKEMESDSVDLVLTDPPYNAQIKYGNNFDDSKEWKRYSRWLLKAIKESERISKGPVMVFLSNRGMREMIRLYQPYWVCAWVRGPGNPAGNINGTLMIPYWEPCLVYGNVKRVRARLHDTWIFSHEMKRTNHPCPKSLSLIERIISSGEWNTILDPFLGSGTTLVAAERLGRNSIGIEIFKEYCEIAYKRLLKEVKQSKLDRGLSTVERIGF